VTASPVRRALLPLVTVTVTVALAVVALLGVAAAKVPAKERNQHSAQQLADARTEAMAVATSSVATVLSYDYRHLSQDFAKAEALLTPAFRKQYVQTTAKAVQPLAGRYRAISSAQVTGAGVVSATPTEVVVLVFVDQTVTNTQLAAPRLDKSRIKATLVHTGGRWLIDGLDPI
jgi:Mce-associated membrane protein